MIKINHAKYVLIQVDDKIKNNFENIYKSVKINKTYLLFVPYDKSNNLFKNLYGKYRIVTVSWSIMCPVLIKLSDEDWYFKFENDEDWEKLEKINEESNKPKERLKKVREYFENKYYWAKGIPDPVLHTRLIITPQQGNTDFVFYYGETVELQNTGQKDIESLFKLIMEQYEKVEYPLIEG